MVLPDKLRRMQGRRSEAELEKPKPPSRSRRLEPELAQDPIAFLSRSLASEANDVVHSELATHSPKNTGDSLPEPSRDIPDYDAYTPDQRVEALAAFKVKFDEIRASCPDQNPPEVNEHSDLRKLHIQENVYLRKLSIKRAVGTKKNYLVVFWVIVEVAMRCLGLDFKGYTKSQIDSLKSYDEMLTMSSSAAYRHTDAVDLAEDADWSPGMRTAYMAAKSVLFTLGVAVACAVLKWMGVPIEAAKAMIPIVSSWMNGAGEETGNRADSRLISMADAVATNNPIKVVQAVVGGQGESD